MKLLASSLCIFISSFFCTLAQTGHYPCKTDEMHQQLFSLYPQYNQAIINANDKLEKDTKLFLENGATKSGATYVIPVVFHIIHNNGIENIKDAQIHDALKQVNLQFRKLNPDTNEIVSAFKSIAADIEVEFRLAQLDPDGNCTSGITRTVSSLTSPGNHDVKSLIHWPQNKYLNIYVCAAASGLAGHALLPAAADTIPNWDGIVMDHSYVGTIGTSIYFNRTVLTHEIGHFLNLQHIWGGNNVPNYYYLPVAQSGNCSFDDEVDDTPNTIGWQSCNLNGNTCGDLDNVQNYMDYAYCGRMFTLGQKARMHACLNSSVANRNNLWQPANLIATGTDDINFYLCEAQFESNKQIACVGDTIEFYDNSFHGIQSREWVFNGGNAISTTTETTKVVYSNPGTYDIKLVVHQNQESRELLIPNYITILPQTGIPSFHIETFENSFDPMTITLQNPLDKKWETTNVGFNSDHSFYLKNYEVTSNATYDFYLKPINLSGLSSAVISFDVSYSQKNTSNNDLLKVSVSTDCGKTWQLRRTLSGLSSLKTISTPILSEFFPASNNDWKNQTVTLSNSLLTNNLMVQFSFQANGGNNIFIDNIQVGHPNQLSIKSLNENNSINIYPNPSREFIFINSDQDLIQKIEVLNLEGKQVQTIENQSSKNEISLSTDSIENGTYIIRIYTENSIYNHVQIVSR